MMMGRQGTRPTKGTPLLRTVRECDLHMDGVLGCVSTALANMNKDRLDEAREALDRLITHVVDVRSELRRVEIIAKGLK